MHEVLSWKREVDNICTNLAKTNGILPTLRDFVPRKHMYQYTSLYFTLMFFMVVWFGTNHLNVI